MCTVYGLSNGLLCKGAVREGQQYMLKGHTLTEACKSAHTHKTTLAMA